jgi:hypothetical protein
VFEGLAEGGAAAALKGEVVKMEVGVWEERLEEVTLEERVEAEDGTGRHRGPLVTPAIPEFRVKSVTLLS